MARKSKSKIFFPNLILLVIGLVVITYSVFNIINLGLIRKPSNTVLNSLENEYYVVGKDPTTLQKETFNLLTEEVEKTDKDYLKISELVSESFVIDFFNWSNKDASYDIGGLQYVYDPQTFNSIAHLEYYQRVDMFNQTYGKKNLPEVTSVKSDVKKTDKYKLNDKEYEAYFSKLSWDYASSSKLDVNEFVDEVELVLINDEGKIKIVEVRMLDDTNGEVNYDE